MRSMLKWLTQMNENIPNSSMSYTEEVRHILTNHYWAMKNDPDRVNNWNILSLGQCYEFMSN